MSVNYWQDKPLPLTKKFKKDLLVNNRLVIIATAREFSQSWVDFIHTEIGEPDALVFREVGSNIGGAELKIKGITEVLKQFNCVSIDSSKITVYEDNHEYLKALCDHFKCSGEYIPSQQGH